MEKYVLYNIILKRKYLNVSHNIEHFTHHSRIMTEGKNEIKEQSLVFFRCGNGSRFLFRSLYLPSSFPVSHSLPYVIWHRNSLTGIGSEYYASNKRNEQWIIFGKIARETSQMWHTFRTIPEVIKLWNMLYKDQLETINFLVP